MDEAFVSILAFDVTIHFVIFCLHEVHVWIDILKGQYRHDQQGMESEC